MLPEKRTLGAPGVVGRRGQRPVLPARGRDDRQHRLLVPGRRRRHDRERRDRGHRAAPNARCSPTRSSTTCSTRRTRSRTTAGSATNRRRTASIPTRRVADGFVPTHLASAIIRPQDFDRGLPAAAAEPRRREGLGRRLVEVHRRCLIDLRSTRRLVAGARRPRCRLARPAVRSCRSTASWPSRSATSTRSSATPCRCGTRLAWDFTPFDEILERVFGGELGRVFLRTFVYVGVALVDLLPDRLPGRLLRRRGTPGRAAACCSASCWRRSGSTT